MKHLRPTTIIACLALFLAMGGGAWAAQKYVITSKSQIKPSVLDQLKGERGPKGPKGNRAIKGFRGFRGTQETKGFRGIQGSPGANGTGSIVVEHKQVEVGPLAEGATVNRSGSARRAPPQPEAVDGLTASSF